MPQDPGHGSWHLAFIHALSLWQSEWIVHSGRQFGGLPMKFGWHEQDGTLPIFLHSALGPQGDGIHGSKFGGDSTKKRKIFIEYIWIELYKNFENGKWILLYFILIFNNNYCFKFITAV